MDARKNKLYALLLISMIFNSGCIPLEKGSKVVNLEPNQYDVFTWENKNNNPLRVTFEHYSGGPMNIFTLDKNNFNRFLEGLDFEFYKSFTSQSVTANFQSDWYPITNYQGTLFIVAAPASSSLGSSGKYKFEIKLF